jgi:hypothetical protein
VVAEFWKLGILMFPTQMSSNSSSHLGPLINRLLAVETG